MDRLPSELLYLVFDVVPTAELLKMRLISRSIRDVASDLYFSKTKVLIDNRQQLQKLQDLSTTGSCATTLPIRHLKLGPFAWFFTRDIIDYIADDVVDDDDESSIQTHDFDSIEDDDEGTQTLNFDYRYIDWIYDDGGIQTLGQLEPLLSSVHTLSLVFRQQMATTTLHRVKWGVLRHVFCLSKLRHLQLFLPEIMLFYPSPSAFSSNLTVLHLAGHFDLRAILNFLQQLPQLVILHVELSKKSNLNDQPLERFAAEGLANLQQNRHIQELSYTCQRGNRPGVINLARLLFFFFYIAPCLDKLIIKHPNHNERRALPLQNVDRSTAPYDATRPFWAHIGFPRVLYVADGVKYGPKQPLFPQQPTMDTTKSTSSSHLQEIYIRNSNSSAMINLFEFLPIGTVHTLVFDYSSGQAAALVVHDNTRRQILWPHLIPALPLLSSLTSLMVLSARDLCLEHLGLSTQTAPIHLNHLKMSECDVVGPRTFDELLRTCLLPRHLTLDKCFCNHGPLGTMNLDNPWVPILTPLHEAQQWFDIANFGWWSLPESILHLKFSSQGAAIRVIFVLQSKKLACGPATRVWISGRTNSRIGNCYELSSDDVGHLFSYAAAHFQEWLDPHRDRRASSNPSFYEEACRLLEDNFITVISCPYLQSFSVEGQGIRIDHHLESTNWPFS
ncbi:hypothetical protein BC940DRAFT_351626 [Gongronella butleri]|nr:hypothetical protein BC940DRAFT_351626 [Gongronella butleri]